MSSRKDAKEALAKLKAQRTEGASRLEDYKIEEEGNIYDEITEDEYSALRRRRMQEGEDFVVDDDGLGYVDYGQDEWGSDRSDASESNEEGYNSKDAKGKRKRGKGKEDKKANPKENIRNAFNKQAKNAKPKPKLAPPISAAAEDDLIGSIFNDLDNEVNDHVPKRLKSNHDSPVSTSLYLSRIDRDYTIERDSTDIVMEEPKARKADTAIKIADDDPPKVKTEPVQQDAYGFQTQEAFDTSYSFDDSFMDGIDDGVLEDLEKSAVAAMEPKQKIDNARPIVEVKVKPLQTRASKRTSAMSFVPKFERVEAEADATVVSAADNANCRGWMSMKDSIAVQNVDASQSQSISTGGAEVLEQDGSLRFYWFDAFEKDGIVYLFGKVMNKKDGSYVSCCVSVHNIQRNLFVLPREKMLDDGGHETDIEVETTHVYSEFDELRRKHRISEFASAKVARRYAFELPGVPAESDYLKVVYPFTQPALPANLSGKSFSRIFGTNTNALELFILKRKLMGPCWVEIKDAKLTNKSLSWCKVEVTVDDPKSLNPLKEGDESAPKQAPPLVVMSLTLRTVMNHKKHVNEVVVASGLVYNNVNIDGATLDLQQPSRFTVMRQLNDIPLPAGFNDLLQRQRTKVEVPRNERGLLSFLIAQIHRSDPDIIVGHNFIDFDLDVLLHRMRANKVDHWSRIGRLRRTKWPKLQTGAGGTADSTFAERQIASGRLLCDTYRAAQDLIRSKSYSLTQLAASQLNVDRPNIDYEKIPTYFWDANKLLEMIQHCEFDGYLQAQLMFKLQVLPLTKQLTNLAGNLWARTMTGARAERNEYLLLHEFHNKKFVVPDRSLPNASKVVVDQAQELEDDEQAQPKKASSRRKPAYAGGLVLEPKKGFYDKFVLLLDFNSLYPSIIQEYNICFTTVERTHGGAEDQLPDVPDPDLQKGILPKLLATLVDRRRLVKNLMKDPKATPAELAQYDTRQKALKLTANSMYGCLGFSHSRFYAKPLAMLITAKGREILQNTVDLAEQEKLEVIYGDTDSIMINTNSDDLAQVRKIGNEFKRAVNKRYNLLEIEMDGFFQRMLLLKKKKYAALAVEEKDGRLQTTLEFKGLDLVRRDWCGLSQDVSGYVLNQIFSGDGKEEVVEKIHKHLTKVGEEVRQGLIPIDKFVINKSLTKNPEEYADKKSQPHVQVALQMKAKGISARVGDTIPYVICEGEGSLIAAKARHPDEVRKDSNLKIDVEWYLSNQVHPPVARLCAPIEGTDTARIADCLGLDASKYHSVSVGGGTGDADELYTLESQLTDEERFRNVAKWAPRCRWCREPHEFGGVFRMLGDNLISNLTCPNTSCNRDMPVASLLAQLSNAIRAHIKRYANGWLICEDQACRTRMRSMGVYGERCLVTGCKGTIKFEYPDSALYTQLLYYERLFDVPSVEAEVRSDKGKLAQFNVILQKDGDGFRRLSGLVSQYMEKNGRRYVDLGKIFAFCAPKTG